MIDIYQPVGFSFESVQDERERERERANEVERFNKAMLTNTHAHNSW